MPPRALPSTTGLSLRVDLVPDPYKRLILCAYPPTGLPGVELPAGWDEIPGARGCTPEARGFRDHAQGLAEQGASVAELSTQTTSNQREAATRLKLPFPLLGESDPRLATLLHRPTFEISLHRKCDGGAGVSCRSVSRSLFATPVSRRVSSLPPSQVATRMRSWPTSESERWWTGARSATER
jgi:peroxiredoxin